MSNMFGMEKAAVKQSGNIRGYAKVSMTSWKKA